MLTEQASAGQTRKGSGAQENSVVDFWRLEVEIRGRARGISALLRFQGGQLTSKRHVCGKWIINLS